MVSSAKFLLDVAAGGAAIATIVGFAGSLTTIRWGGREVVILGLSIIRPRNSGTSAFQEVEFNAAACVDRSNLKK
ncbi:MAG TPA: hypothetical protein DCE56_01080 [Cyanobacteria bacterium UBA8553]|nr:hypothetical protein [Cyanobacteria bacterium UBA8553]